MVDTTSTNALNGSESKSLKIALPEASKNIVVTPDDKMVYSMVSGTNVRFSAKKASDKDTSYSMKIYFTLSEDKFESDYGCFAKYFVDPKAQIRQKHRNHLMMRLQTVFTTIFTVRP